jgi:putative RNA 2'-phosphotransferase
MPNDNVTISKFLSLVLRHKPHEIAVTLDEAGWVDVDTLLAACASHRFPITRPQLETVVAASDKQRFAFSEDGKRIRANQGHSLDVELGHVSPSPRGGAPDTFSQCVTDRGLA